MCQGSGWESKTPERCERCVRAEAKARTERMIELRHSGLLNHQIAERLGLSLQGVVNAFYRAHRYGLTVPPSPYRERGILKRARPHNP